MAYRWIGDEDTERSERELIVSVCKYPERFLEIADIVQARDFETDVYKELFSIAEDLDGEGQLTMPKVLYKAKQTGLLARFEDPQNFAQRLMKTAVSPELWNDYAEKVLDLSIRRKAEATGREIYNFAQTEEFSIDGVVKIAQGLEDWERHEEENFQNYMVEYYEEKISGKIDETPTLGFDKIDAWMKGIGRNRLIVLAGRPGTGKTALALHILRHIASKEKFGIPMMFSLEMEKKELIDRMIASAAGINGLRLMRNELTEEEQTRISTPIDRISKLNMILDDKSNVTISYIKRKALAAKKKHGQLACIIIDYLGLMNMQRKNGETSAEAIERTTRELKLFAKQIGCSIIVLAQLNRDNEKSDRRPRPSDLRGSGAIEQDADMIFLLYHDESVKTDKYTSRVEFIVGKGRQTGTNTFYLDFIQPIQRLIEVFDK